MDAPNDVWRDKHAAASFVAVLAGVPSLFKAAYYDLLAWAKTNCPYLAPGDELSCWADKFVNHYIAATPISDDEADEVHAFHSSLSCIVLTFLYPSHRPRSVLAKNARRKRSFAKPSRPSF